LPCKQTVVGSIPTVGSKNGVVNENPKV
jgi:hypothetical protein